MGKLFGTDGVRGKANGLLTADLAYRLGRAGASVLTSLHKRPRILIGKDTRISGDMLEAAFIAGICSVGADVLPLGVIPTPAVALLTKRLDVDAGVMISASHNHFGDNGIKFFSHDGYKLSDELEGKIEAIVLGDIEIKSPQDDAVGRIIPFGDAMEQYIQMLVSAADADLSGMDIVLDCANGAASMVAPEVFRRLGASVLAICDKPDGININDECGSTKIETLQSVIKARGGGVGFAFDGDADRMIAVDEKGEIIDGDYVMAVCAADMKREGKLAKNTVVGTVMSNLGLEEFLKSNGMTLERTKVGDRYVIERMLERGFNFGGEASGHVIFHDANTTGDGILSAIKTACAVRKSGSTLDKLKDCVKKYPLLLLNVRVEGNAGEILKLPVVKDATREAEDSLNGSGRVLIRASGTEPLIRIMVEGSDGDAVKECAEKLERVIKGCVG